MQIDEQLNFIYAAGETRRFHTWPVLRHQNIADHSWHVALLLHLLYGQESPGIPPVLLMAALCHDMSECQMGDLPSPGKRAMGEHFPDFRKKWGEQEEKLLSQYSLDWDQYLTDEDRRRLKFCDNMEGALYCCRERAMGNKMITKPFINFRNYMSELILENVERDAYNYVNSKWEEAR